MSEFLLLITMVFFHIFDDFYLQGILANMKQKDWWAKNYPDKLYRNDYKIALFIHSFSWSFMIHVPCIIYVYLLNKSIMSHSVIVSFVVNLICHAIVDNLKANKHEISLCTDQAIHFIQVLIVWLMIITCAR